VFEDPNITLFAYVFVIGSVVVALVWFLFVVPAERRYHQRKLQAVQEQIRRREEALSNEIDNAPDNSENSNS
jgi:membrane protein YdbS with pleckstrin-like domain